MYNIEKIKQSIKESNMKLLNKISFKNIKKLPKMLLIVFIGILVVISVIISANKMMEYLSIYEENELLRAVYNNKLLEIDELNYYLGAEIDDDYKERMARLIGYCYPDEIIFYIE